MAALPKKTAIHLIDSPPPLIARSLARQVAAKRLERDPLTELTTRAAFWYELSRALTEDGPHTVVAFDIDHFKRLNDRHGHVAGDAVLQAAAARLLALSPKGSVVARSGGEEFAVYFGVGNEGACRFAESVLDSFRASPCADIDVRLSAGVASVDGAGSASALVRQADEALYAAKGEGRDRVVSYEQLALAARENDRDVSLAAFETRTKVIAERVAEAITARGRQLFDKLQKRADVDVVTGLYSRGYLDRRLAFELEQAAREETPMTVALVDLDHFGEVNKTYGWPTGDEALRAVSEALSASVRATDWVARYGGEELCVVMFGAGADVARGVLERLLQIVAALTITAVNGSEFGLTVSIGAASAEGGDDSAALLERASACLLAAKRAGRNRLTL